MTINSSTGEPEAAQNVATAVPERVDGSMLRRITVAASVGSMIEYFDLSVYGAFAVVMANVFFPGGDATVSLLNTFAVFALAFVARPIGGLIWGPLGDRIGRKHTLAAIIIVMALATGLVGMLPSHASIGLLAPLALVLLRFIQGISAGGEIPGAATFVAEHANQRKRAFQVSFLMWGVAVGMIGGLLIATLLFSVLSTEQMNSWGWRVPFLLGLPFGAIGLYVRSKVAESPEFRKVEQSARKVDNPLRALLGNRTGWKMLGRAILFNLPAAFTGFLLLTYMPVFLKTHLGFSSGQALLAVTLSVLAAMATQPLAARLSDRFGRRPILLSVCLFEMAVTYPAFALLQSNHGAGALVLAALGLMIIGVIHGAATGTQSAPTLESFPTRIRYTGFAMALGLVTAILAGPTPYIATWLVSVTGSGYAPAWLLIASAVPPTIGFFFIKETAHRPLPT